MYIHEPPLYLRTLYLFDKSLWEFYLAFQHMAMEQDFENPILPQITFLLLSQFIFFALIFWDTYPKIKDIKHTRIFPKKKKDPNLDLTKNKTNTTNQKKG